MPRLTGLLVWLVWGWMPLALSQESQETVSLQLKWHHQFQFAGYYAALEQGYYQTAGLAVRLLEGSPTRDAVAIVVAGQADFGISNSELLLHRYRGAPVVALAAVIQHSPLSLLVRRDSEIRNVRDLAGRRLMMGPDAAELLAYFKQAGLTADHFEKWPQSQNALDLLKDQQIDGVTAYITNQAFLMHKAGIATFELRAIQGGIDFYGDTLFTTETQIRQHPERVAAFRAASLKGWDYALNHIDDLVELIQSRYAPHKTREQLLWEAEGYRQLVVPDIVELGHMSPNRWRHIADTYAELDMLPPGYDFSGLLYNPSAFDLSALHPWLGGGLLIILMLSIFSLHILFRRRTLQRAYAQQEKMAANLPGAIYQYHLRTRGGGGFPYVSQGIRELAGISPEALHDNDTPLWAQLHPGDLARIIDSRAASARHLTTWSFEGRVHHPQRGEIWWAGKGTPERLPNGDTLWYGFLTDITDFKHNEEALAHAKEVAETANQAKSTFLSSMSHEVRTPLNAILGFAQLLEMQGSAPLTEGHREAIRHILSSGQHLLHIINEVLDLSRIEAGRLDLTIKPVPVDAVIQSAADLVASLAQKRGITLHLPQSTPWIVQADEGRLRQVLSNFLSNAVKYNRVGGSVTLSCQPDKEGLRMSVTDTGAGIPEARFNELFQPFHRLGAEQTAVEGSGIGLVICQRLIETMGGCIGFESRVGTGSTFWVELPLASQRVEPASPLVKTTAPESTRITGRVLYVEDNRVNRLMMSHVFRRLPKVELQLAESAEEGLAMIGQSLPDLVLMDINLPGISGIEALKILKADDRTTRIPVIAVSAAAMEREIAEGLQAGFHGYLSKPINIPQLLEQLHAILG